MPHGRNRTALGPRRLALALAKRRGEGIKRSKPRFARSSGLKFLLSGGIAPGIAARRFAERQKRSKRSSLRPLRRYLEDARADTEAADASPAVKRSRASRALTETRRPLATIRTTAAVTSRARRKQQIAETGYAVESLSRARSVLPHNDVQLTSQTDRPRRQSRARARSSRHRENEVSTSYADRDVYTNVRACLYVQRS